MAQNPKTERDEYWLENPDEQPVDQADLTGLLDRHFAHGPEPTRTQRAVETLKKSLKEMRDPEVVYGGFAHPKLGPVFVALGARGVLAVNFGISEATFRAEIRRRTDAEPKRSDEDTATAARQLSDYLDGNRTDFDLPLDLASLTAFQQRVLLATAGVPPGEVATYAEIAARIGQPRAYRAVGQALGRNPVPILIPCHRVIATDGSLGGYSGGGGVKTKAHLLALEGASF